MVLLIGLPCGTILTVLLVWWRINLVTLTCSARGEAILSDIAARTQVILAQNRDVLRRLEEMGP
jgi:hypothetical protein